MKNFKLWNLVCGWLVFAIAAATYLLTMEPTASFWDCGEFIVSANKLDVGHPPGAPFFMLIGRFATLFATDQAHVAMCVNAVSALASALTILFLFWTITALGRKLVSTVNCQLHRPSRGWTRRLIGLYLLRHFLVLCGGRRGICPLIFIHSGSVLADSQMGRTGRRRRIG